MANGRTIAVVGASNALGRRVVAALDADPGVTTLVTLDEDELEGGLKARLAGADGLVVAGWLQAQDTRRVGAMRRLLDDAAAVGVVHLVHVSSAAVYGAWADNPVPLPDDAPLRPNPGFAFATEHAEVERLVLEWKASTRDATAVVLRPAVVVGEGCDTPLARALAGITGIGSGDGSRPLQLLHVDDLAAAVLVALRTRLDGAFNVGPDGWVTEELGRALAGGTARLRLPDRAATVARAVIRRLAGGDLWPGVQAFTEHPWVVASERLRAAGWEPSHTTEEAYVATSRPPRLEIRPQRRQEVALAASAAILAGTVAGVAGFARARARARRRRRP